MQGGCLRNATAPQPWSLGTMVKPHNRSTSPDWFLLLPDITVVCRWNTFCVGEWKGFTSLRVAAILPPSQASFQSCFLPKTAVIGPAVNLGIRRAAVKHVNITLPTWAKTTITTSVAYRSFVNQSTIVPCRKHMEMLVFFYLYIIKVKSEMKFAFCCSSPVGRISPGISGFAACRVIADFLISHSCSVRERGNPKFKTDLC